MNRKFVNRMLGEGSSSLQLSATAVICYFFLHFSSFFFLSTFSSLVLLLPFQLNYALLLPRRLPIKGAPSSRQIDSSQLAQDLLHFTFTLYSNSFDRMQ
jgi:hypothetical protein